MFSKLVRLSAIKSIVRIDIDLRIISWANSIAKWELLVCFVTEVFLILQFWLIHGSILTRFVHLLYLTCLMAFPLLVRLIERFAISFKIPNPMAFAQYFVASGGTGILLLRFVFGDATVHTDSFSLLFEWLLLIILVDPKCQNYSYFPLANLDMRCFQRARVFCARKIHDRFITYMRVTHEPVADGAARSTTSPCAVSNILVDAICLLLGSISQGIALTLVSTVFPCINPRSPRTLFSSVDCLLFMVVVAPFYVLVSMMHTVIHHRQEFVQPLATLGLWRKLADLPQGILESSLHELSSGQRYVQGDIVIVKSSELPINPNNNVGRNASRSKEYFELLSHIATPSQQDLLICCEEMWLSSLIFNAFGHDFCCPLPDSPAFHSLLAATALNAAFAVIVAFLQSSKFVFLSAGTVIFIFVEISSWVMLTTLEPVQTTNIGGNSGVSIDSSCRATTTFNGHTETKGNEEAASVSRKEIQTKKRRE